MRALVVTPPAPIVGWADLDAHLRLFGDDSERAYIEGLAVAATATIDGPGGWLGRCLGRQELEARLDGFAPAGLKLPYPEIIGITSVKYFDPAGVEQVMDPADYELAGSVLSPKWGAAWPSAAGGGREAVRVRYEAGFVEDDHRLQRARIAVLLMVADVFEHRTTVAVGASAAAIPMSMTVKDLLSTLRVYF